MLNAALTLLHESAETSIVAVCAAHPAIETAIRTDPVPSLERLADHVVHHAMLMLDALDRYQRFLHDHDRLHRGAFDQVDTIF